MLRAGSAGIVAALAAFTAYSSRRGTPAAASAMRLTLRVAQERFAVALSPERPAVIGRSRDADLFVADGEVSRRHALLQLAGGVAYLRDLGSANGTFLNGTAVFDEGIEVRVGDDIDVGSTRITLERMEPITWT